MQANGERHVCPDCTPEVSVVMFDLGYQPFTLVRDAGTLAGAVAEAGWHRGAA